MGQLSKIKHLHLHLSGNIGCWNGSVLSREPIDWIDMNHPWNGIKYLIAFHFAGLGKEVGGRVSCLCERTDWSLFPLDTFCSSEAKISIIRVLFRGWLGWLRCIVGLSLYAAVLHCISTYWRIFIWASIIEKACCRLQSVSAMYSRKSARCRERL